MGELTAGALLRKLRAEVGRSQSEQASVLSELAGRPVTRNEVSRWENEARLLTPFWQQHYADSFDVPVCIVFRAVAVTKAERRLSQRTEGQNLGERVERREFISTMAGLAVGWPQALHGLQGHQVGASQATQLLARTARLRRLDDFLGGADTYQLYASELGDTTRFVRDASCTSRTRLELTAVIAEQAQLAGWAAFDAGMHKAAKQHYLTSLAAAKEADNTPLAGNSLAFLAYQQISTDKPSIEMATASYAMAERDATPKVRALLLERMAWTHAVAGQAKETERALADATEALHSADDRQEPDWVFWVDDNELNIMAGRCWTELKRPLRAVPTLEAVLAQYADTHARDKSMYLTWLAHAYLDAGEVEQAASVTGRAIELATGVASARPTQRIDKVLRRLRSHAMSPNVKAVLQQVTLD